MIRLSSNGKFSRNEIKLAIYAKAIAHPARIAIIHFLAQKGKSCFSDISNEIPLSASTVSQHLLELKKSGLIRSNYEPPKVFYLINNDDMKQARKLLKEFAKLKPVNTDRKD